MTELEAVAVDMALASGAPWPWISAADRSAESAERLFLTVLRALPRPSQESPEASAKANADEWARSFTGGATSDRQYTIAAIAFLLSRESAKDEAVRDHLESIARKRAEQPRSAEDEARAAVASCGDIGDDAIDSALASEYGPR